MEVDGVAAGVNPRPTGSIDGAEKASPKGSPQRRMAFVGRGEAKAQVEFSACGKWNIVACASTREVAEHSEVGGVMVGSVYPSVSLFG